MQRQTKIEGRKRGTDIVRKNETSQEKIHGQIDRKIRGG